MARYCCEKGTICDYANEENKCINDSCINTNLNIKPEYEISSYFTLSRRCEICKRSTRDENNHLCPECLTKLKKILYNI